VIQKKNYIRYVFDNVTNFLKCCKKNGLNCYCDVIKDYEIFIKFESKLISNMYNVQRLNIRRPILKR